MRLRWSLLAIRDRDAIFGYIEQRDPAAAIKVDERIGRQIETLV
jgi:toxin ParE1/3/4